MKTTLFSTIGAIALTSLAITLAPTTASAHGGSSKGGSKGSKGSSGHPSKQSGHPSKGGNSGRPSKGTTCSHPSKGTSGHPSKGHPSKQCNSGHGHHCSSLPHGCREVNYHGHHCWYGGGHYYRCSDYGGYEICDDYSDDSDYSTVSNVVTQYVDTSSYDDSDDTISCLPSGYETVYVGGERCFYSDGCYYKHCGRGYKKFNCDSHGHGHGDSCKNKGGNNYPKTGRPGKGANGSYPTGNKGNKGNKGGKGTGSHPTGNKGTGNKGTGNKGTGSHPHGTSGGKGGKSGGHGRR